MAVMTPRATFALDASAITRLRKLATIWHTAQAEVIRRSLEIAEQTHSQSKEITHRLQAAEQLRKRLKTRKIDVDSWMETVRESRS
jgi:hypothetical protein